ncbi:MAG: hypothetical protein NTX84_03270 [Nitrospirae bacterium]|nr:hypothetical protein [Nitrospirota bacterium]
MRGSLIIYCLLFALAGCASSGRIGELPLLSAGTPTAKLTVMRVSSIVGVAVTFFVVLDGEEIFAIGSGEHTEFKIGVGEHYVGAKHFGGWTPTWKENAVRFTALAEKEYFFEISPNLLTGSAEIQSVEPAAAEKRIATSTFISPETRSSSH